MTGTKKRSAKAGPDPIFAVIERVRKAELACDALDDGFDSAVTDEFWKARSAFAKTVPTTPAGLVAFAAYVNEAQKRMCGANPYFDTVWDAEAFALTLQTAAIKLVTL